MAAWSNRPPDGQSKTSLERGDVYFRVSLRKDRRMQNNQVDEIKGRLDVAELIRGYMKLEKSGVNFLQLIVKG